MSFFRNLSSNCLVKSISQLNKYTSGGIDFCVHWCYRSWRFCSTGHIV